jgi:hypothetical protein
MDPQLIVYRVTRLVRFDTSALEDMRDDATATIPAVVVAFLSFLLAGFGGWLWWVVEDYGSKGKAFWQSCLLGSVFGTALWVAWIAVAYIVLVNVFHYSANLERCIRTCGLATLPVALSFFMFIPAINIAIGIAALALMFLLMDIAIQVSVDALPSHVIAATFAGFLVFCIVLALLVQEDTWLAPGVFLFRAPASSLSHAISSVKSISSLVP